MKPLGPSPANRWHVSARLVDTTRAMPPPRPLELEAAPKRLVIDLARTALIVVDMQNDFCSAGGWLDHIGVDFAPARAPIAPLNDLTPRLRAAGVPVIWVNWGNRPDLRNVPPALMHVYNGDGESVGLGDPLPGNGAPVLTKDSWSAAIVDDLIRDPSDAWVDKFRMSGFWDTPLDSVLRMAGVTTVLFGGVNADQCVLATLMDANFLGYDTVLLEDCSATTSPAFCWQATLYNVRQCFGFTATGTDLAAALDR